MRGGKWRAVVHLDIADAIGAEDQCRAVAEEIAWVIYVEPAREGFRQHARFASKKTVSATGQRQAGQSIEFVE